MILFFDTETTGKLDFRAPPEANHQPRLVQLACLLTDDAGKELSSINIVVKPNGFEIPVSATAIHGYTTQAATDLGLDLSTVLFLLNDLRQKPHVVVAHNIDFDLKIVEGELRRGDFDCEDGIFGDARIFCTMKSMTPVCKLPGKYGDYKWPKLQEAYKHAFGVEFDGAHDALADVRACAKVYFWLKDHEAKKNEVAAALIEKNPTAEFKEGE